jgi:glycosyltransferase involved in cell wall biosynthesis
MAKKKTVLFISNDASLTGAPILLLNLIKLVKEKNEFDVSVLSVKGGPLFQEFQKVAKAGFLKPKGYKEKRTQKLLVLFRVFINLHLWLNADIIFNNTAVNGEYLNVFQKIRKKPIVSYIHELEKFLIDPAIKKAATLTVEHSKVFVSPNPYNRNIISRLYNIVPDSIHILRYYMISSPDVYIKLAERADLKREFFRKLGIERTDALAVLGMGLFSERKGADYFIETAKVLSQQNVQFFWIGSDEHKDFFDQMMEFVRAQHISNFHFLGQLRHSLENFLPFDVLFLSSREDPYPVVVLEAALMQMPTVYFSKSGGIQEFVTDDCGWAIEEFSTTKAADKIESLTKPDISQKGLAAQAKVSAWHLDGDAIYSGFKGILSEAIAQSGSAPELS